MKKIDIHCHTTNKIPTHVLPVSASIDAIVAQMEKYDIERTILLPTYFPRKGTGISNFRLFDRIRDHPQLSMFGSLDFGTYFQRDYDELEELAQREVIKGIKVYSGYQTIDFTSGHFNKVLKLARAHALPIMFHCGYTYDRGNDFLPADAHPKVLETIAKENPDIAFIAAHLALPYIDDIIEIVRNNPNVYADSSGLINSRSNRPEIPQCIGKIRKFLDACGVDHLIFGTDFPVQTHKDSVFLIEKAMRGYPDADKRKVYYDNSRRLLCPS